jgi:hypothetical protein
MVSKRRESRSIARLASLSSPVRAGSFLVGTQLFGEHYEVEVLGKLRHELLKEEGTAYAMVSRKTVQSA